MAEVARKPGRETLDLLATNVRRLRGELELSQEGLSVECGLDRTYVSDIEAGRHNPTLGSIERLAEGLGLLERPGVLLLPQEDIERLRLSVPAKTRKRRR